MTLRELIQLIGDRPFVLSSILAFSPLASWLIGRLHGRGNGGRSPWRYLYSAIVYLTCMPGILASVLTGYALFFRNDNLLDVNVLVYILPVVSMTITLFVIRNSVDFDEIPGFDRLSGLMVMIAVSFAVALAVTKTRIWLFFGGSIGTLVVVCAGVFALLKWGAYMFFRRRDEPRIEPPSSAMS